MRTQLVLMMLAAAVPAAAQEVDAIRTESEWQRNARFYGGVRAGLGIPPRGRGVVPSVGLELGVAQPSGLGFGLQFLGMTNPPAVPLFNIDKADWGIGALADARFYFETIDPLTLYVMATAGFVAGPSSATGENVVLPLISPGLGARVRLSDTVVSAFEFGFGAFSVPFVTMVMTWEPPRKQRPSRQIVTAPAERAPQAPAARPPPLSPTEMILNAEAGK